VVAAEVGRDSLVVVARVAGLNLRVLRLQAEKMIALREMVRMSKVALWLSFRSFVHKSRVERLVRSRCVLKCNAWEVAGVGVLPEGVGQTLQEHRLVIRDLQSYS
tara:strand:- start:316 stop:630 length:315 start_codon:yes stop_codon:yes gene_type:complete